MVKRNNKGKKGRKKKRKAHPLYGLELEVVIRHVDGPGKLGPLSLVVDLLHWNVIFLTPAHGTFFSQIKTTKNSNVRVSPSEGPGRVQSRGKELSCSHHLEYTEHN